jgi:hypothetical protein
MIMGSVGGLRVRTWEMKPDGMSSIATAHAKAMAKLDPLPVLVYGGLRAIPGLPSHPLFS